MSESGETQGLLAPMEQRKSFYFLQKKKSSTNKEIETEPGSGAVGNKSWMNPFGLFGSSSRNTQPEGKPRKLPVKVEPKVFFANERTFLSWLQMSVTLASISFAIIAFSGTHEWSQIYGICLMPVAIAFSVYALWMYMKRAAMIRRKDPGPYEDRVGPVVLAAMLGVAILVNFFVKLYHLSQ